MTHNLRIIKAAADFLNDIARVSRMSKANCEVADQHAQELYAVIQHTFHAKAGVSVAWDMDALNKTITESFKQHARDIIGQEHAFSLGYKLAFSALSTKQQEPVGELHGPYGWLNGHRELSEANWVLERNPIQNNDEYFSIPLYVSIDPINEASKDFVPPETLGLLEILQIMVAYFEGSTGDPELFPEENRILSDARDVITDYRRAADRALWNNEIAKRNAEEIPNNSDDSLSDCFRHHVITTIGWAAFASRPGREMQMYEDGFKAGYSRCKEDNEPELGEVEAHESEHPVIHAVFETSDNNVTGSTSASVKRIDANDDGSFTVVVDYWPNTVGSVAVTDEMIKRYRNKFKEIFPGSGWPDRDTTAALISATLAHQPVTAGLEKARKEEFIAGWKVNAVEAENELDQKYLDGCAVVDYEEWLAALKSEGRK